MDGLYRIFLFCKFFYKRKRRPCGLPFARGASLNEEAAEKVSPSSLMDVAVLMVKVVGVDSLESLAHYSVANSAWKDQ
jgi:hypothetical protein